MDINQPDWQLSAVNAIISQRHIYEIPPRKDQRGVHLISDALPVAAHIYDDADKLIEITNTKGDFKEW